MNENNIAVRLFFSKTGRAKYISALDLITCFQRAIRRTDIPIWHTQGFNPHTYVNVNLPLSLGSEGINESMDIKLTEQTDFDVVRDKLNAVLPPDIRIIRVDGTMYSCTSLGIKLGGGIGIAITGWLLDLSGFDGTLAVQSDSCIQMLQIMYLWVPVVIALIITFIMSKMNVERANEKLLQEQALKEEDDNWYN